MMRWKITKGRSGAGVSGVIRLFRFHVVMRSVTCIDLFSSDHFLRMLLWERRHLLCCLLDSVQITTLVRDPSEHHRHKTREKKQKSQLNLETNNYVQFRSLSFTPDQHPPVCKI